MFDLYQQLWHVLSLLMGLRLEVKLVPGKQQAAADALGRNPVWPGTFENSSETGNDSGYEGAYYVASEYRYSRMYKDV